jgi:hypothetical protein
MRAPSIDPAPQRAPRMPTPRTPTFARVTSIAGLLGIAAALLAAVTGMCGITTHP